MKDDIRHLKSKNAHTLPEWTFLLAIGSIIVCSYLSDYLFNARFPRALTDPVSHPNDFIGEQAWKYLEGLTKIGVRVVGTRENEVFAVEYLLNETQKIKNKANPAQEIEIDHQVVSGTYQINFWSYEWANVYRNVQNIIVRLAGSSKSRDSLMLNCHFDSVPGSPGASDDAANCAIMMETLRVLSKSNTRLKHPIIFLFNGAEETPLQASHGFITQHKWAKDIKTFVNLESCGSGGKELLFQAGPKNPWLIKMYSNVPHPSAQVAAEEVFQSGIIPSDTDFRIFRDFGQLQGLDFAHNRNGYRYHTRYDSIHFLSPSFLQRTGDNVLVLSKNIANSNEIEHTKEIPSADSVYFDVLGIGFVHYSADFGAVLNIAISLIAFLTPFFAWLRVTRRTGTHMKYLLFSTVFGSVIIGVAAAMSGFAAAAVAWTFDQFGCTMSWYGSPILATVVYGSISLGTMLLVVDVLHSIIPRSVSPVSASLNVQSYLNGVNGFWGVLVFASILFGYRFSYGVIVGLMVNLITTVINMCYGWINTPKKWIIVHFVGQLFTITWTTFIVNMVAGAFISIMGRTSGDINPDYRIGGLLFAGTTLVCSYLIPLILLVRNRAHCYMSLLLIGIGTMLLICFTNFGFPYQAAGLEEPRVQRHYVTHAQRTFYDMSGNIRYTDAGFYFRELDRNAKKTIDLVTTPGNLLHQLDPKVCRNETYCGLPVWHVRQLDAGGYWLPAARPTLTHANRLQQIGKHQVTANERVYNFTLTENVMSVLIIRPNIEAGVQLIDWDLGKAKFDLSEASAYRKAKGFPAMITHGLKNRGLTSFWIKLKASNSLPESQPWVDILLITHHWEYHREFTSEFKNLLQRFPEWAYVVPNVANVDAYKF